MQKLFFIVLCISSSFIFSQEKPKDTLNTNVIDVVKPYSPKVSDAFKIKDNPQVKESESFKKETIKYNIFSAPVVSTFTPSKGKAKGISVAKQEEIYDNYISVGFGNFTTPFLDAYIHSSSNKNNDFGVFLNYLSSKGGINHLQLYDNYSDAKIDLYYKQIDQDYSWQLNGGYHRQLINWYGVSDEIDYSQSFIDTFNEEQIYQTIYFGGKINFNDGFVDGATVKLQHFSDSYNTDELHFKIIPKLVLPIASENINTLFSLEYLGGKFNQGFTDVNQVKHSFLNLGVSPNLEVLRNNLTLNLGVKLYYSFDLDNKNNQFLAYPNVTASYKILEESFIGYVGVTGDLLQNSYHDFVAENPYVSPTLNVEITDQQYNAFVGFKGKNANVNYNFKGFYKSEKNKPLFIQNPSQSNGIVFVNNAYELGNSFSVIYDDVNSFGILGEIDIEFTKQFTFGGNVEFNNYSLTTELEAWNLPDLKASLFANYNQDKWYGQAKLYFRGKTNDYEIPVGSFGSIISNDSFVDLNLQGGYKFTNQLTAFVKVNNVLGTNYDRFRNYKVQGLQVLGGITFKFDF